MNKIHVTVVSLILGLSAALGIAAATDTVGLRASAAPSVSDAELTARATRLAKAEKAIMKARDSKPPALPAVPASSGAATQRVVFQRSAPVVSSSMSGHDDELEDDHGRHGHGGEDDHGGDDD
jgi:hypothetical protein